MDTESPIEEMLLHELRKHVDRESVEFLSQVTFETVAGQFRVDFFLSDKTRRIAIECDGKDFHDPRRDEWRDGMLLGAGHVDEVIRFRGCDIVHHLDALIFYLANIHPWLFTERGRAVIAGKVSDRIGAIEVDNGSGPAFAIGHYGDGRLRRLLVYRWNNDGLRQFWHKLYAFAQQHPGTPLDELIQLWDRKQGRR